VHKNVAGIINSGDATKHPGAESFDGELARLLIYGTAHTAAEMEVVFAGLMEAYSIQ